MKRSIFGFGLAALLIIPSVALAQDGGKSGAANGLDNKNLGRFNTYVRERNIRPYTYSGELAVGGSLPNEGIEYYEVPQEYNVPTYRYTVINGRTVLVDPTTRRVMQILD